jgi:hypothetical protein
MIKDEHAIPIIRGLKNDYGGAGLDRGPFAAGSGVAIDIVDFGKF